MTVFLKKIRNFLFLLICSALISAGGCRRTETGLLGYVPSDSAAILIVNWKSIAGDENLKPLMSGIDFEGQMRRFGVESRSVGEIIVFAAMNSKAGLLFRGEFNRKEIIAHLKSNGWDESSIEGRKVYVQQGDYVSLPDDGLLIAGTEAGIAASFRARENSQDNIASNAAFKKMRASLSANGKSPIAAFLIAPDGTLEAADAALSLTAGAMSFFGWGEIGSILKTLNFAGATGFTFARGTSDGRCAVNFCVLMRDEKTAALAATALNAMKGWSSAVATKASDKENLQSISVSREEKVISVKMEMPREMLMPPAR